MAMEQVSSNMIIAVITVQLLCYEVPYSLSYWFMHASYGFDRAQQLRVKLTNKQVFFPVFQEGKKKRKGCGSLFSPLGTWSGSMRK